MTSRDLPKQGISEPKAAALCAKDARYWSKLGQACLGNEDYDEAIKAYRKALDLDANNADYWNSFGFAYFEKGSYREAWEAFRQAVKLNPDNEIYQGNMKNAASHM